MIIPLSANRICMNALLSLEATSLPNALRRYGLDHSTALSVYGVLTGMAFPLVFFPNALTSSVSILLLPEISANMSSNKITKIKITKKKDKIKHFIKKERTLVLC